MGSSQSSLFSAVEDNNLAKVRELIKDNSKDSSAKAVLESEHLCDSEGRNALHIACIHGHLDIAKVFVLECDIDLELKSESTGQTALSYAADNNHIEIVSFLLDLPPSSSSSSESVKKTPNVDTRDRFGKTPLALASFRNFVDIVLLLLKHGANIDSHDERGHTPLSVACMRGHMLTAHALIQKGADADSADLEGFTPLMQACSACNLGIVNLLLHDAEITNINAVTYEEKNSALMFAVSKGASDIVRVLLDNCADAELKNIHGMYALRIAQVAKHQNIVRMLQTHSGDRSRKVATEHFKHVHAAEMAQKVEDKEKDDEIRRLLAKLEEKINDKEKDDDDENEDEEGEKLKSKGGVYYSRHGGVSCQNEAKTYQSQVEKDREEQFLSEHFLVGVGSSAMDDEFDRKHPDHYNQSSSRDKNTITTDQHQTKTTRKNSAKKLQEDDLIVPLLGDHHTFVHHQSTDGRNHYTVEVKPSPPKSNSKRNDDDDESLDEEQE